MKLSQNEFVKYGSYVSLALNKNINHKYKSSEEEDIISYDTFNKILEENKVVSKEYSRNISTNNSFSNSEISQLAKNYSSQAYKLGLVNNNEQLINNDYYKKKALKAYNL